MGTFFIVAALFAVVGIVIEIFTDKNNPDKGSYAETGICLGIAIIVIGLMLQV